MEEEISILPILDNKYALILKDTVEELDFNYTERKYLYNKDIKIISVTFNHCYKLTKILDSCFQNDLLVGITIPKSVKYIGKYCFSNCSNLRYFILEQGTMCEFDEYSLSYLTLSSFCTKEGINIIKFCKFRENCFYSTTLLQTDLTLFNCYLDDSVFNESILPMNLNIINNSSIGIIHNYMFKSCRIYNLKLIYDNIIAFCKSSFESIKNLEEIKIPFGVKLLSKKAFKNSSLKKVYLPYSLKILGTSCFKGSKNLSEVIFYNKGNNQDKFGIDYIPTKFFKDCNIKKITFPNGIKYYLDEFLANNYNLTYLEFPGCTKMIE